MAAIAGKAWGWSGCLPSAMARGTEGAALTGDLVLDPFEPGFSRVAIDRELFHFQELGYPYLAKVNIAALSDKAAISIYKKIEDGKITGIDYRAIADRFNSAGMFLSFNGTIYRYKEGVFSDDRGQLEGEIVQELLDRGIAATDRVTTATQQVRHYIQYHNPCAEYPFNKEPDLIPVSNGALRINYDTGEVDLLSHNPAFRFNYTLKVRYDATADKAAVKSYLDTLGVERDILLQIPAHALLSMTGRVYKKAYFIKGDPDSGKSTFIDLITRYLFGPAVCSSISLQALLYDRFRLAELDGKVLNAYADLSDQKIRDVGLFKALTGGDAVTVERKHRDPYSMVNKALLVFSGNKYPAIDAGDEAFWGRWNAISFPNKFPVDPKFEERTFTDQFVSGLLLLVVERMTGIIKEGKIIVTESVENEWLADSSSAYFFFTQSLERCPGAVLIKNDVFSKYVEFCTAGDYEIQGKSILTDIIQRHGGLSTYPKIKTRQEHCYQGFKFKGQDPVYPDACRKKDTQNSLHMQHMQDENTLHAYVRENKDSSTYIEKVTDFQPAYPAYGIYAGKSRAELVAIREQYLPGQPPDPDAFMAAWKSVGARP